MHEYKHGCIKKYIYEFSKKNRKEMRKIISRRRKILKISNHALKK